MHDHKLIMFGDPPKECTRQMWSQSDEQYVRKWAETAQPLAEARTNRARPKVKHAWGIIEYTHFVWRQSDERFVCECAVTGRRIRGQERAGTQRSITEIIRNASTEAGPNPCYPWRK